MSGLATCPQCGGDRFEEGFIDEMSVGNGRVRWAAGQFRAGIFGGARGRGIGRGLPVLAFRCQDCDRLELYVSGVAHDSENPYGSGEPGPDGAVL